MSLRLPIANLPGILADVQRLCGDDTAIRFAAHFGDRTLHIPQLGRLRDDHPLVMALGRRAARLIASQLGGQEYRVPTGRWSMSHHNARVLRLNGWQPRPIARALALHKGTVDRLTADLQPAVPDPQPVTLTCPCCGRAYKLTPPPQQEKAGVVEDDTTFLAAQPPLLRAAVAAGDLTVEDLRRLGSGRP